jgi:uncharacterized protein (DUF362 family)
MLSDKYNKLHTTERRVVAYRNPGLRYPFKAPFDPQQPFPEYPFGPHGISDESNLVYEAVREVLHDAGLDQDRFGRQDWNPMGDLVSEGGTVLIKPNWVRHYHTFGGDIFSVVTHPAVLRPLIDYAFKAVGTRGRIWLMDAPHYDADFAAIMRHCQLAEFEAFMRGRGVPLTVADLRSSIVEMDRGVVVERHWRETWASEGVIFDLGNESELAELGPHLGHLFGSDYNRRWTKSVHRQINGTQRHCYSISRRALEADLIISVPKLKTHKKTGVSLNIKNMIGINTDKNYIPHFRIGSPAQGGDEFPDTQSRLKQARRFAVRNGREIVLGRLGERGERLAHVFMTGLLAAREKQYEQKAGHPIDPVDIFYQSVQGDSYRSGNWWGNDTCWRSALDINKILLYGTIDGRLTRSDPRPYFSLIDGVVGGDQAGPLEPRARPEGVLVAGFDPLSVDHVATQIMGFDPDLIRDQRRGAQLTHHPLTRSDLPIRVVSRRPEWRDMIQPGSSLNFEPHYAWEEYLQSLTSATD